MGVPITFFDKYNPDQFEIVGITKTWFGGSSKIYHTQIQIAKSGKQSEVSKLNDGAAINLPKKHTKKLTTLLMESTIFKYMPES